MNLRVLCIGSPQPGDDVAWRLGERLLDDGIPSGVEVRLLDRPGAGLIEAMQGCAAVLLLDAAHGVAPGEVRCIASLAELWVAALSSTHGFGVAEALRLAERLGRLPANLEILALGPPGDTEDGIQSMVDEVRRRFRGR